MADRRAVSSVVGVILLIGFTLVTITTVLAVGAVVLNGAQTDAHTSQMENSMSQMASKVSLVALDKSGEMNFHLGDVGDGDVIVDPDAGSVTVIHRNNTSETTLFTRSFGVVKYEYGNTEIAYQGGGVWRGPETGSAMLSPPEFHYRSETLTFPIVRIVDSPQTSKSPAGSIYKHQSGIPIYPNGPHENPLVDGTVLVEIRSDYHHAWNRFFIQRTETAVTHYPDNKTVVVNLTVPFNATFTNPITATEPGGIDVNGGDPPSSWADGEDRFLSASETIQNRIDECEGNASACTTVTDPDLPTGMTFNDSTTYYLDQDATVASDTTFNTSDGNIHLVIDGSLDVENKNIIVEGDNELIVYLNGSFSLDGSGSVNAGKSADQFTLYVHSDATGSPTINLGSGTPTLSGAVYAPNSDAELSGNAKLSGSVIVEEITINGAPSGDITYDTSLADKGPQVDMPPDQVKYLHITDNQVRVEMSDG